MDVKKILSSALFTALACSSAMASGYQVNLQGQKQVAMGNTGAGVAFDASSIFFNPAGLGFTDKNSLVLGGNFIKSSVKFHAPNNNTIHETESPLGTPFFLYGSYKINDKLKAGLGVFTPFGSSVKWKEGWAGRYALTEIGLAAVYIQPTVSYKINDVLSVGGGVDFVMGSVDLKKDIPLNNQTNDEVGKAHLSGKSKVGVGYNVGVFFKPNEKFSAGLNYRSGVKLKVEDGDANFEVPASATGSFTAKKFDAELPMPSVTTLGFGFYPNEKLTVAVDVSYVNWEVYKSLILNYDGLVAGAPSSASERKYKSSFIYKIGAEYNVTEKIDVRAGFYYDRSPVEDGYMTPETPDSDSMGFTFGAGYKLNEKLSLDLSLLLIDKKERSNVAAQFAGTISGTYKATAFIPGFSVNYAF